MPTRFMCFFALRAPANKIIVSSDAFTFCCWAQFELDRNKMSLPHRWQSAPEQCETFWDCQRRGFVKGGKSEPMWEDLLNATVRTVRPSEFMDRFTWINEVISHSTFTSPWEFDVSSLLQNVSNFFLLFSFFNLNNLWLKGERDMLENKFTCQLIIQSMWQQRGLKSQTRGTKIGWNEANLSIIDRSRVDSAAKRNEMLN